MRPRRLPRVRPWALWTLRSRLVLVIAVLAGVALVGANAAGLLLLRSYLTDRVDAQLRNQSRPFAAGLRPGPVPSAGAASTGVPGGPRTTAAPSAGTPSRAGTPSQAGAAPRATVNGTGYGRARFGPDQVLVVYRPDGTVDPAHTSTSATAPPPAPWADVLAHAERGRPYTVVGADGTTPWRLLAVRVERGGGAAVVGSSLAEASATGERLLLIDVAVTGTVLVLLGLLAASVVRLGLRPLTRMELVVAKISGGDLARRVDYTDPHTEAGRLGAAVNLMLGRIESEMSARDASERRLRQFLADASHELRTPLTSIRGFAELYRRGGAPPGPVLDEAMGRIEAEASRMGLLVEDLLLLARLDRERPPNLRPVDLLEIAADTIRDAHARVPERRVRLAPLRDDGAPWDPPVVLGDEHRLRQVAANLVANALQHTPTRVAVTVRVGRADEVAAADGVVRSALPPATGPASLAVLEVVDDGPGVPSADAGRVFERLYRADPSRSRVRGGGSGLGLSIVASIVHAHGGWAELETRPGRTTFRVLLPAAAPPAPVGVVGPPAPAVPSKL